MKNELRILGNKLHIEVQILSKSEQIMDDEYLKRIRIIK